MSSNKNYTISIIFSNQDTTSEFMWCVRKQNLILILWRDIDGDILKDAYIKERKVAFLIQKAAKIYLYSGQKQIITLTFYIG